MKNKRQVVVMMDDGGGYAMRVPSEKYTTSAPIYGYQIADMLIAICDGDTTATWDNNMWGQGITLYDDYCRTYDGTAYQVMRKICRDYREGNSYGANHDELAVALINRRSDW